MLYLLSVFFYYFARVKIVQSLFTCYNTILKAFASGKYIWRGQIAFKNRGKYFSFQWEECILLEITFQCHHGS